MKKNIFILLLILISKTSIGQSLPDGWSLLTVDGKGTQYLYNTKALISTGWPPKIISIPISSVDASGVSRGYTTWEFHCETEQVKSGEGSLISVSNEGGTIRRTMLTLLCGLNQNDGHWFHNLTHIDNQSKKIAYLLFDARNVQRVTVPYSGIRTSYISGELNMVGKPYFTPLEGTKYDLIYSCTEPKLFWKKATDNDFSNEVNITPTSYNAAIRHLFCNGHFSQLAQSVVSRPDSDKSIETAKKQCIDLGFKMNTESYGRCVLQLSK